MGFDGIYHEHYDMGGSEDGVYRCTKIRSSLGIGGRSEFSGPGSGDSMGCFSAGSNLENFGKIWLKHLENIWTHGEFLKLFHYGKTMGME